ncbi:DUF4286 family protein [Piscirickettsia litoralis]|uniref:DUF4286 domain-containing protein n=1 Tax=Piscirickettsia litoralis TaxID=1891921 RepID=A0ABX3A372_9GAMM|nr:DUF4286 family protein [Piscirickettsia litoralis]ODN43321.1 hypothetical protein BGC07_10795 [Piscirickettsia litoralis]
MVIYEVNLNIDIGIFDEYKSWLTLHMKEMMSFKGFLKADLCDDIENDRGLTEQAVTKNLTALYLIDSEKNLQHYFDHYAKSMRDDGIKQFGNQFRATRKIFKVSKSFNNSSVNEK